MALWHTEKGSRFMDKEISKEENQIRLENLLTFTEKEVEIVAAFINEVFLKARFDNMTGKDIQRINTLFNEMHFHHKKLTDHIFEIKKVVNKPKEKK
jgi:chemotaxis regulatin CheY-phosphate phosphatase CheZ